MPDFHIDKALTIIDKVVEKEDVEFYGIIVKNSW